MLEACWKHAAGTLQVKHAPYVMHFLTNKYVNMDVKSLFLNLTNAMASTKILKHPVGLQACCRQMQGVQSWQGRGVMVKKSRF